MLFADDLVTVLLGTTALLVLSMYTLLRCRSELPPETSRDDRSHWFQAMKPKHSFAGAIGSAFSVTYLGASTIYGHLYKGWFLLFIAISIPVQVAFARKIVATAYSSVNIETLTSRRSNILLELLRNRLSSRAFRSVLLVYAIVYFFLLVEELAVSRILLSIIFPTHPAVPAAILATICMIITVYIKWGGYKAVLISDYEQLKLLLPFLVALVFLSLRTGIPIELSNWFSKPPKSSIYSFPIAFVLFLAWLGASTDAFARLNFELASHAVARIRHRAFAGVSVALLCATFLLPAAFGAMLPPSFGTTLAPSSFTQQGVAYVQAHGTTVTNLIFFAGFFCMVFTTIDTLLATFLQIGVYRKSSLASQHAVSRVLLVAVLFSCFFWPDSVSAIGVFIGSLLIIPLLAICSSLNQWLRLLLPKSGRYPSYSLAFSVIVFVSQYGDLEVAFYDHIRIPLVVIAATLACAATEKIIELSKRRSVT